jgi:hypothetical protein
VAGPVLSHPSLRKRFFLDQPDLAIETIENVPGPVGGIAVHNYDFLFGIVQSDQ